MRRAAGTGRFGRLNAAWLATAVIAAVPALGVGLFSSTAGGQSAQQVEPAGPEVPTIASLKGVKPLKANVADYILDKVAAQQLGKALFWDIQVGSSGIACASCHFHGGADIRTKNQVNPGLLAGDATFANRYKLAGLLGPNETLNNSDFPFHRLVDPHDRESDVLYDSNDVTSSQGSFGGAFVSSNLAAPQTDPTGKIAPRRAANKRLRKLPSNETCDNVYAPDANPFHVNNLIYRKVEPRNSPTTINAVFNHRQFWDGRANSQFNGVDPFGPRTFRPFADGVGNPNAARVGTLVTAAPAKTAGVGLKLEKRLIDNASLASQAVGPPLSDFEMSCGGKTFADLGRKLLPLRALAYQRVDTTDSLFGKSPAMINALLAKGLKLTYKQLIEKAFRPKFWSNTTKVVINADGSLSPSANGFTQMEHNFALFWGLAIQEYESLLVSDDSPFDRAKNGNPNAMSAAAQAGETVFMTKGKCVNCHNGPLLSSAAVTSSNGPSPKVVEYMQMGSGALALYDNGFYNIGVRPSVEDLGAGAGDPYGFDLSFTRQFKWRQSGQPARSPDKYDAHACSWEFQFQPCAEEPTWSDPLETARDAVDGAFKTPILRNVGLNPPYFHNGGTDTLKDVVRFYNRGGDRRGPLHSDTTGVPTPNPFGQIAESNLDPDIGDASNTSGNHGLGLTAKEIDDLVQFMLALTDDRVACHAGVFDHPELPLSMGHRDVPADGTQLAKDIVRTLPATGAGGLKKIGKPCFPNSGSLNGSDNPLDPQPLQAVFSTILAEPDAAQLKLFPSLRLLAPALP